MTDKLTYSYGAESRKQLKTCHPDLVRLFERCLELMNQRLADGRKGTDIRIIEGVRTLARQQELLKNGHTRTLNSRHFRMKDGYSHAIDAAPFPVVWEDIEKFRLFGGFVLGVAETMQIPIRWGGDWDGDFTNKDQRFMDLVHFELIERKE